MNVRFCRAFMMVTSSTAISTSCRRQVGALDLRNHALLPSCCKGSYSAHLELCWWCRVVSLRWSAIVALLYSRKPCLPGEQANVCCWYVHAPSSRLIEGDPCNAVGMKLVLPGRTIERCDLGSDVLKPPQGLIQDLRSV